ncbi:GNAT family N-acetyltransferase [Hymenobacter rigui]|uniref:N-acetyltransferase n=1 Tax=Hymenobacter rigui TaxID=334424 RepID=A0A428KWA1_9BACT|nr:GNAT family protein [Hymenobacter rigui]RSK50967.1 N-acetyltransferase [Hymenobacter rigui]
MSEPCTIRRLQPQDAPAYRRLRLACLAEYPASFGSSAEEEERVGELPFEQHIRAGNPEAFVLGAFAADELVGMCGFVRASRQKVQHQGEIRQVCVAPTYAGHGLGRRLMQATLEAAFALPGLEQISLGVVAGNTAATRLYQGLGFVEYGYQRQFLKLGSDYYDHRLMVLFRSDFIASTVHEHQQ